MAQTYAVTVVQDGGNKYAIDGVTTPTLNLLRGFVYIFDQSDSSNNGHPLRFKDADGSSYSTGVVVSGTPGNAGAKVTLTVGSDATEPSRYYCTVHGNAMGNTIALETFTVGMSTAAFKGWNSSTQGWNTGAWNADVAITSATGGVGAVTAEGEGDIAVSGVAATGSVGAATAAATANLAVTGVAGTGGVGSVLVSFIGGASVTGVAGTGSVGSTSASGPANVFVTGVSGTGEIGSLQQPWGQIIPSQTPFWNTIAA
jgi:hypothetical protein